jgi:hypothetical protein
MEGRLRSITNSRKLSKFLTNFRNGKKSKNKKPGRLKNRHRRSLKRRRERKEQQGRG